MHAPDSDSATPSSPVVVPSNTKIIWSGELLEGRLILAVTPEYSLFRHTNEVYFAITGADNAHLTGVMHPVSGVHTSEDLIAHIKIEWARFNMEYRDADHVTQH